MCSSMSKSKPLSFMLSPSQPLSLAICSACANIDLVSGYSERK